MEQTITLTVDERNMTTNTSDHNTSSFFSRPCSISGVELPIYTFTSLPSKGYYINFVICCLVNALLTCSTITLNSLTVLAYWKSSQLRKKTCYFLVMLLSLSDLAVGVLSNSIFTAYLAVETLAGHSGCFLAVFFFHR